MQAIFSIPQNQTVVKTSMSSLVEAMKIYDKDDSGRLSRAETDNFFRDQFSAHCSNYELLVTDVVPAVFTPSESCAQQAKSSTAHGSNALPVGDSPTWPRPPSIKRSLSFNHDSLPLLARAVRRALLSQPKNYNSNIIIQM